MAKKSTEKASVVKEKKSKTSKEIKPAETTLQKKAKSTATTTAKKKSVASKKVENKNIIEYYDLPNNYNQTIVKVLFQTPKKLFVYWEISEMDKNKYIEKNGSNFFETTTPFLVVTNETNNYSFEIEINDFANSWYFDIPDSSSKYSAKLIRKSKVNKTETFIASSNNVEVPNNHILFEQNRKEVFFKNVKTNNVTSKSTVNLQFINHVGNAYNANLFYNKFYSKEDLEELTNPTSN